MKLVILLVALCACETGGSTRPYTAADCAKSCAPLPIAQITPGFVTDGESVWRGQANTALKYAVPCVCGAPLQVTK